MRPVSRRSWIAFATCSVLWGIPYFLIKVAVEDTSPLIVAMMSIRFNPSERVTGVRLVGLFVGLAGVIALVGIDVAGEPKELIGAACMIVATVGYAAGPMMIRVKMSDLHPMGPVSAS